MPITDSCDVVRRKIRAFLDNGEMKVGDFQKAINTNSNTYSRFMSQNGPYKGAGSTVYGQAWLFFKKRELRGIKPPRHPTKPKNPKAAAGTAAQAGPALATVDLPGESDDSVEVYDTCDEIRRKINAHLKKPGVTQAQFLRDIAASYKRAPRKIQSSQLSAFRSKKGAYEGNTSAVYYGAYVFFEKMRIAEKKPKSKKRLDMEEIHGMHGGMDTERRRDRFWVAAGEAPHVDKYGRVSIY
ncbi:hypothetical protein IQ06DRAFT_317593 [Phaeosphaeriaceae sp. SRC1lsM3a]|nr:hypothetical protein IQ06DRAFT_317593 [Stagonospora sp. SRC1lsM3a]